MVAVGISKGKGKQRRIMNAKTTSLACALAFGLCATAFGEETSPAPSDTASAADTAPAAVTTDQQPAPVAVEANPAEPCDTQPSTCCKKADDAPCEKTPETDMAEDGNKEPEAENTGYTPLTFQWPESGNDSEEIKEGGVDE